MDTPGPAHAIQLRGVRVHNLQNVDVDIPRGQLVAICGVSGSGKTSLALDTLYAEGQRRYIESFSAYTRQFLERLEKPDYDRIEGLPPAVAVTRGGARRGNRSTVGTASETLDYLRLLFASIGRLSCYRCQQPVVSHSPQSVSQWIAAMPSGPRLMVGFAVQWEDAPERAAVLADLQQRGFVRLLVAKRLVNISRESREELAQILPTAGQVHVVVDRFQAGDKAERTTESLEHAFEQGHGVIYVHLEGPPSDWTASSLTANLDVSEVDGAQWCIAQLNRNLQCPSCDIEFPSPEPRLFSFNSPLGACSLCEGFGDTSDLDPQLIVPDGRQTLREGAVAPWNSPAYEHHLDRLLELSDDLQVPVDTPFHKLTKRQQRVVLEGEPSLGYGGVREFFQRLERKKYKMHVRVFLSRWRSYSRCSQCGGARLSPEALSFRIGGKNLAQLCDMQVAQLAEFLNSLQLSEREQTVAAGPLEQVRTRLDYLQAVGLGYLQLARPLRTLSGGEAQRTSLTAALGSTLVDMLYVLDEPSVGLHPHDVERLAEAILRLSARGNTVVIVEHEEALLRRADTIVEIGPGAGRQGGRVVFAGTQEELDGSSSLTAEYLTGKRQIHVPEQRRAAKRQVILKGCRGNNLRSLTVSFPLEVLCLVTGVSGSGKSSLVQDTLYGALANRLTSARHTTLPFDTITGVGQLDDCILVDQSPVSRSPRSNPVTYVKAFDEIRAALAGTLEARTRNLTPGHFSFNSDLGRCPECKGDGVQQIDMQFLADVQMTCPACRGKRYRPEILNIRYRDQSIADILSMTVREASDFFRGANKVRQKLKVLVDVGLEYLQLGQAASTLSSGESQRLKLAGYLAAASRKRTLFLLDEPTTGLHPHDIVRLLDCFDALLSAGHSLVVVEHNIQLIAAADHIIDLGPGPADLGGQIVAAGSPTEIMNCDQSVTGKYLRAMEQAC